jgi:hypothetical protein
LTPDENSSVSNHIQAVYIDNLVAGKKYWLVVKHRTSDEDESLIDGAEDHENYDSDFSLKLHFAEKDIY